MLELTYVSLLFMAFLTSGFGFILGDWRRFLAHTISMVLWATVAFNSFGVQPSFGSGSPVNHEGMFALAFGATFIMVIFVLDAAVGVFPQVGPGAKSGGASTTEKLKTTLRGNNKL